LSFSSALQETEVGRKGGIAKVDCIVEGIQDIFIYKTCTIDGDLEAGAERKYVELL
jgi:hypothetical protein